MDSTPPVLSRPSGPEDGGPGGKVTHELKIIRSVGARLTDAQRDTLAEHPEVKRIWEDHETEVQSAGR